MIQPLNRVKVMQEFAPYMRVLQCIDPENFRGHDAHTIGGNVLLAVCMIVCFLALPVLIWLGYWFCAEHQFVLGEITATVPVTIHSTQYLVVYISMTLKRRRIYDTIERVQALVDDRCRTSPESTAIYERQEQKHAFICGTLAKFSKTQYAMLHVTAALMPIAFLLLHFPPPELWVQIFAVHELFNQQSFVGFYLNWFIGMTSSAIFFIALLAVAVLFTGMSFYVTGMVDDMRAQIERMGGAKIDGSAAQRKLRQLTIWTGYVREFRFHLEIIDLAETLRYVMLDLLFYQLLICAVIMAFNLFGLETAKLDLYTVLAFTELMCTIVPTYIYCYLSEQLTADLLDIGDIFYSSDWYRLPVHLQRLVTLPMLRSQRPILLSGLGLIDCSLSVFLSVGQLTIASLVKTAGSYFLLMRSF